MSPRALVIDDEADIRELIEITLARMGVDSDSAADLQQSHERLSSKRYDLCLTDMRLPDGDGIEIVEHIQGHYPQTPVAVITAYGNTEAAVASLKAGAFDFVSKPVDIHVLRRLVDQALRVNAEEKTPQAREGMRSAERSPRLIGDTAVMDKLRRTIEKLARSQAPVYISGESGTGKELAARTIHAQGSRSAANFVPVNCGAIPSELMESEFFGHIKGSFTGATRDKDGLFVTASDGTLFLDEVAELPLHMQVKLLRAIQERSVRPVGAEKETPVDVRIISATHRDLAAEVAAGRFREDLYYRLNVIELRVPPLRERQADIPLLANRILDALGPKNGFDTPPRLSDAAMQAMLNYSFPGNVRELENVLERAVTLCEDAEITQEFLRLDAPMPTAKPSAAPAAPLPEAQHRPPPTNGGQLDNQLEDVERETIMKALEATRFNKTQAAKKLGITFRALRYRLKKLGIE